MNVRQIRQAAVLLATELLKAQGYEVSAGDRGYDLTATKGDDELHIEVKGAGAPIASLGRFRRLTSSEFDAARQDPSWQLWVIENLSKPSEARVTKIPRHEVLARARMEISWMIPVGQWCRELSQAVGAETVAKATAQIGEDSS